MIIPESHFNRPEGYNFLAGWTMVKSPRTAVRNGNSVALRSGAVMMLISHEIADMMDFTSVQRDEGVISISAKN